MDLQNLNFNEKISNPSTSLLNAMMLGAAYGIPAAALVRIAKGKKIEPWMLAAGGAIGLATGAGVNEFNRRHFAEEFKKWEKNKALEKTALTDNKIINVIGKRLGPYGSSAQETYLHQYLRKTPHKLKPETGAHDWFLKVIQDIQKDKK